MGALCKDCPLGRLSLDEPGQPEQPFAFQHADHGFGLPATCIDKLAQGFFDGRDHDLAVGGPPL